VKRGCGLHRGRAEFRLSREEGDIRLRYLAARDFPRIGIKQLEIDLEEASQLDEGAGVRGVHEIVEGKEVAGIAQLAADGKNLVVG